MNKVLRLTKHEINKIYSQNIIIGFMCVSIMVFAMYAVYVKEYDSYSFSSNKLQDWRNNIEMEENYIIGLLNDPSLLISENLRVEYTNQCKVYEYHLQNDIPPIAEDTASNMVLRANRLFIYIMISVIMLSCYFITSEYSNKTLGRILTAGAKRWKVLLSKYLAIIFFSLVFMLLFAIVTILFSWIVFGFDDFSTNYVYYDGAKVVERNVLLQMVLNFAYNLVSLIAISALAVFVAVLTRSNLIGVTICFAITVFGSMFSDMMVETEWIKYSLFANTDFSRFLNNKVAFNNFTPLASIGVLAFHTMLFVLGTFIIFQKQDVVI